MMDGMDRTMNKISMKEIHKIYMKDVQKMNKVRGNTMIISSMSRRQPQKRIFSGNFGGSVILGDTPL